MRFMAGRATVVAVALAVVATGLVACGSDEDEKTAATTESTAPGTVVDSGKAFIEEGGPSIETIIVRNGEPVDGIAKLEYDAGEQVRFRVSSDEADEVHVHGYDVGEEIPAGGTATLSFPADIEGIFEVELHGSEKQIAELRVNP